jgi:chitodextrinase
MLGLAVAFGFAQPSARPTFGTVHDTAEKTNPQQVEPLSLIHTVTYQGPQSGARGLMVSGAFTNGAWRVQFMSQGSNCLHTLERSTDLLTWTQVDNAVAGTNELVSLADQDPPAMRSFYRVRARSLPLIPAAQSAIAQLARPHTYTTAFPNTENPISENGNWINGGTVGLDWADIRTTPGFAYSASSLPSTFGDPTAVLAGTWGPTQTASAVVMISTAPSGGEAEVELRLRSSISAHRCTGYEFLYSLFGSYWQIVRWNGPLGDFTYIGSSGSGLALVTGDVLTATVTNSTFYFYLNGSLLGKATDSTFPGGSPGIGFYPNSSTLDWGFSSFTASDGTTSGGGGNSDTIRPSTPTGLSASAISSSQINLSWNASTDNVGVAGYTIYRGGTQVATSGSTTYSDTGLSPSTFYTFTVSAYDAAGNASPQSTNASATTLAQAGRSWAHRQTGARNSSAASNALAFGAATQSGDLIIVEVDWSSGSTFTSLSDSQGNVYTQIGTEQNSAAVGVKSRLYYAKNIKGGAVTITSLVSGSPLYHELYIHEYSGLSATDPLDAYSVKVGSGSSFTSGSLTTTAANELLYGVEIDSGAGSASAGWTTRSSFDSNVAADKNMLTVGTAAFTGGSAGAFIAWIAAFK